MRIYFWIAEGLCFYNLGWIFSRVVLNYRGIQSVLWPVTLGVRAIARDSFRDPKPEIANPQRVKELEEELGIGQEGREALRKAAYGHLTAPQGPAAPKGPAGQKGPDAPKGPAGRSWATAGHTEPDGEDKWMDAFGGFQ